MYLNVILVWNKTFNFGVSVNMQIEFLLKLNLFELDAKFTSWSKKLIE